MAPKEPKAWLDEKDFGFWIPVVADGKRPAFYIPYLWVDDYLPQQAGREVFGYQKGVGVLKNPASPTDPAEFSIDALVVPSFGEPGNPEAQWQWRRLVTLARRGGGAFGDLVRELESMAELGEEVLKHLKDRSLLSDIEIMAAAEIGPQMRELAEDRAQHLVTRRQCVGDGRLP